MAVILGSSTKLGSWQMADPDDIGLIDSKCRGVLNNGNIALLNYPGGFTIFNKNNEQITKVDGAIPNGSGLFELSNGNIFIFGDNDYAIYGQDGVAVVPNTSWSTTNVINDGLQFPDGKILLVGQAGICRLMEENGTFIRETSWAYATGTIFSTALSPDGTRLALFGDGKGEIGLVSNFVATPSNWANRQSSAILSGFKKVRDAVWVSNERVMFVGDDRNRGHWDYSTGSLLASNSSMSIDSGTIICAIEYIPQMSSVIYGGQPSQITQSTAHAEATETRIDTWDAGTGFDIYTIHENNGIVLIGGETGYYELHSFNSPPNKPTDLNASSDELSPTPIDDIANFDITYTFSDPDAGDTQTSKEYELYDITADEMVSTAVIDNAIASVTGLDVTGREGHVFKFRIKVKDNNGAWSDWSDYIYLLGQFTYTFTADENQTLVGNDKLSILDVGISVNGVIGTYWNIVENEQASKFSNVQLEIEIPATKDLSIELTAPDNKISFFSLIKER